MYERALQGCEEALGPKHTSTLETVHNLDNLYVDQGKLVKAEEMYEWALQGYTDAVGETQVRQYVPALDTLQNMGILYEKQRKYAEAQEMYSRALSGLQIVYGRSHDRCREIEAYLPVLSALQASKVEPVQPPIVEDTSQSGAQQERRNEQGEDEKKKKGGGEKQEKKSFRRWLRQHIPRSSR
jgi:tetratricopeptide (TPR) repeat protein